MSWLGRLTRTHIHRHTRSPLFSWDCVANLSPPYANRRCVGVRKWISVCLLLTPWLIWINWLGKPQVYSFFWGKPLGEKYCTQTPPNKQHAHGAACNRNLPSKGGLDNECKRWARNQSSQRPKLPDRESLWNNCKSYSWYLESAVMGIRNELSLAERSRRTALHWGKTKGISITFHSLTPFVLTAQLQAGNSEKMRRPGRPRGSRKRKKSAAWDCTTKLCIKGSRAFPLAVQSISITNSPGLTGCCTTLDSNIDFCEGMFRGIDDSTASLTDPFHMDWPFWDQK